MRVLQIHLSIEKGGAYTVVKNLSNGLKKIGCSSKEVFQTPIDKLSEFDYDGVLIHSFRGRYIDEYLNSLLFLEKYGVPYVVLLHDYWPICLQTNLMRQKEGLRFCEVDNCDPFECGYYSSNSVSNLDYIDMEKNKEVYNIIKSAKTTTFNQKSVDIFEDNGFSNVKLIYHGIDLNLFKPYPIHKENFTVLFTNAWGEKELKGYKHWEWIKENVDGVEFDDILGKKTLDYMPFFYNNGNCLLFLSLWPETCGLVILEALACDIPVISYDVGIASDVIKDGINGYLVNNVNEVKEAIELVKGGKFDCRESILRFSLENMSKKYIEFMGE